MPRIFAAIGIGADFDSLRQSVPTSDLAYHDTEVARLVEPASARKLPPSVFEEPGRVSPDSFRRYCECPYVGPLAW